MKHSVEANDAVLGNEASKRQTKAGRAIISTRKLVNSQAQERLIISKDQDSYKTNTEHTFNLSDEDHKSRPTRMKRDEAINNPIGDECWWLDQETQLKISAVGQ